MDVKQLAANFAERYGETPSKFQFVDYFAGGTVFTNGNTLYVYRGRAGWGLLAVHERRGKQELMVHSFGSPEGRKTLIERLSQAALPTLLRPTKVDMSASAVLDLRNRVADQAATRSLGLGRELSIDPAAPVAAPAAPPAV